jgi:hypothetical protein
MLRSLKEITGYTLSAIDDDIGRCKDFLFDDHLWTIRYMVADTLRWLPGKKVLVAPNALGEPEWTSKTLNVSLTRKQIKDAPDLDENAPVSRQYEIQYHEHYGWPQYWTGMSVGNPGVNPKPLFEEAAEAATGKTGLARAELKNPNLRSYDEVVGYDISARDGKIGHVADFVVDDTSWRIRYVVVDTRDWLPGREVLLAPSWIYSVDWVEKSVHVNMTKEQVENSPDYDPLEPINREYEERLYNYYGQPVYW